MKGKIIEKKAAMAMAIFIALFAACNDGLGNAGGRNDKGDTARLNKSKRTVIDASRYIDLTAKETEAKKIKKEDILSESFGTFKIENGNSYIKIDRKEGSIVLSSDDAYYNGKSGNNMYVKYLFDVEAANSNCLYIRMKDKKNAQLIMNSETFVNDAVPDLLVCLPLYGFGRNRVEVSSIMNGFIAMPSGTYWAGK